jgi:hypothetical protein
MDDELELARLELVATELETTELALELATLELVVTELAVELATLELVATELARLLATELAAELTGGVTGLESPPPHAETTRLKATKEMRLIFGMIIPLIVG